MVITCKICGETKDENEFYPAIHNKTGRRTYCKICEFKKNNRKLGIDDITNQDILNNFKDIMTGLGYDTSQNINKQFLQRIKDKYGVILD